MTPRSLSIQAFAFVLISAACCIAADHFVSPMGGNIAPFVSWDTAATNIQDAIDAASAGETVWVTNGVYASGGKVMAGDLTNRVVLDKALTIQSVNGPFVTTIQGAWDPVTTNGPLAVRCAWLTNNATLKGFTLFGGATRASGSTGDLQSGGGALNAGPDAVLANCVIRSNAASFMGGGALRGYLQNCLVIGNRVASQYGAGAGSNAILINCTVVSNSSTANGTPSAVFQATLTNCVVYGNFGFGMNYSLSTFAYCCTTPLPAGPGNINLAPQLLGDGYHLATASPCRGAGTGVSVGTDLDGQSWGAPPSIGCDEWYPGATFLAAPALRTTNNPVGFILTASVAGQEPFTCWWTRDGTPLEDDGHYFSSHTTNLVARGLRPYDGGNYQVVSSNAFGSSTSAPFQLPVHHVDGANPNPVSPYQTWQTAANTIQDAIDAASFQEFVLVTNGIYSSGGRVVDGDLTNRVALTKPVIVVSVNGAASTTIQGAWDPVTTNGPAGVRCAWMTNSATLDGFTLRGGATRGPEGGSLLVESGGGVFFPFWGSNALVVNCVICTNSAYAGGGGCYSYWAPNGSVRNSRILGNTTSSSGGGACFTRLANCLVMGNWSASDGGGAESGFLTNCTVTGNYAGGIGGGEYGASAVVNCIIYLNSHGQLHQQFDIYSDWFNSPGINYTFTQPLPPGTGNSTADPQLVLDGFHLSATSPCRAAANPFYVSGSDIDGEPWLNPPSVGCDEYYAADYNGPLFPGPITANNILDRGPVIRNALAGLGTSLIGNADRVSWSFDDGILITNIFTLGPTHTWTNAGDFNVTFTAYNADNPGGVSTNALIHVNMPDSPVLSAAASNGTNLVLSFPIQAGLNYIVEQATTLAPPVAWQSAASLFSYGGMAFLTNNTASNPACFFRVRVQ